MIKMPAWAYYLAHVLLCAWFIYLIVQRDYLAAAFLVVGYVLGRIFRELEER